MNAELEFSLAQEIQAALGYRLCSAYLLGSAARRSDTEHSDIDLLIVVRLRVNDTDLVRVRDLVDRFTAHSYRPLEVTVKGYLNVTRLGCEQLKLGSRFLCGKEIADRVPLPPIAYYIERVSCAAIRSLIRFDDNCGWRRIISEPSNFCRSKFAVGSSCNPKFAAAALANMARAVLAIRLGLYCACKPDNLVLLKIHINYKVGVLTRHAETAFLLSKNEGCNDFPMRNLPHDVASACIALEEMFWDDFRRWAMLRGMSSLSRLTALIDMVDNLDD